MRFKNFKLDYLSCLMEFLFFFKGNLIDHHVKILMNNSYYRGVTILEPDTMEPLERKFPYVSENALNFMKVSNFGNIKNINCPMTNI